MSSSMRFLLWYLIKGPCSELVKISCIRGSNLNFLHPWVLYVKPLKFYLTFHNIVSEVDENLVRFLNACMRGWSVTSWDRMCPWNQVLEGIKWPPKKTEIPRELLRRFEFWELWATPWCGNLFVLFFFFLHHVGRREEFARQPCHIESLFKLRPCQSGSRPPTHPTSTLDLSLWFVFKLFLVKGTLGKSWIHPRPMICGLSSKCTCWKTSMFTKDSTPLCKFVGRTRRPRVLQFSVSPYLPLSSPDWISVIVKSVMFSPWIQPN